MNGKPGSGKSTLMSYLTDHKRTVRALERWANGSDLLIPSFFFWNPGTTLQKSSQGLLRSLLYQIVDHPKSEFLSMAESQVRTMHAWTERALLSEVDDYLKRKPASLSLCFFIDGLDEFFGEQDTLLQGIKLLEDTPRVKVCVSSRPEQVFEQAFRDAPQLRLQDFNHRDITKTANDKLYPALKEYLPREEKEVKILIASVVDRAEGVFLWFQIVVKDLIKGARNHDTMQMLHARLRRMPGTIENLYDHMLASQDSLYQQEAAAYFHILARLGDAARLLLFIFTNNDNGAWDHILVNDYAFFESEEVDTLCERLETRIRTCCVGLVEVDRDSPSRFPDLRFVNGVRLFRNTPTKKKLTRKVRFIHRSVLEYLNQQKLYQDYDQNVATDLNLARCLVGFMGIIPILVPFDVRHDVQLIMDAFVWEAMDVAYSLDERSTEKAVGRALENPAYELVAQIDLVAQQVNIRMNATERSWYRSFFRLDHNSRTPPFFDDLSGFAAFFGLFNYVSHHLSSHHHPLKVLNYLLSCAVNGSRRFLYPQIGIHGSELFERRRSPRFLSDGPVVGTFRVINTLLRQGAKPDSISYIPPWNYGLPGLRELKYHYNYKVSAWASFLMNTFRDDDDKLDSVECLQWLRLWIDVVRSFVLNDADVNTSVFTDFHFHKSRVIVDLEESPLSLIYRKTVHRANDHFEELCNLLQSRGGSEYRRCRLLHFFSKDYNMEKYEIYQVSQDLSDHLLGHILESSVDSHESFFQGVKASLTEADMIRDPQPFTLESSAPHTSKQNETKISKTVRKCSKELDEEGKNQVTG